MIQLTALEDTNVPDKHQWDNAIRFMELTLQKEKDKTLAELNRLIGPGWQERWMYWSSRTNEQVSGFCCYFHPLGGLFSMGSFFEWVSL